MNNPDETEEQREVRQQLVNKFGAENVWNSKEALDKFEFHSFLAPFVTVTEKATGKTGTLQFHHLPRFYFGFVPD